MNLFWILTIVALAACAIFLGIDYSNAVKEQKSKSALFTGYIVLAAALIFVAWWFKSIPVEVVYSAAIVAGVYFGRYFISKIAKRRV